MTDSKGAACEYLLEPQGFRFVQQLQGQDYIVCTSLSHEAKRDLKDQYRKNRTLEISDKTWEQDPLEAEWSDLFSEKPEFKQVDPR